MKIGFSKEKINPSLPVQLGGFAVERISKKIHDDLFVKTMVVNDKEIFKGIIVYDLLAIDHLLLEKLSLEFAKEYIDLDNFIVGVTHTHSGPMGTVDTKNSSSLMYGKDEIFGPVDETYIQHLVNQTLLCVKEAIKNVEECTIKKISYDEFNIGRNRNSEELQGDSKVIAFEITGNKTKNLFVNYACHPTVLNHTNLEVSADYPSSISKNLENDYHVVLFANGACGDISTRFTRKSSGYEEVQRYGELFVEHFKTKSKVEIKHEGFNVENHFVKMITKMPLPLEETIRNIETTRQKVIEAKANGVTGKQLRLIEALSEGANADYVYSKYYNNIKETEIKVTLVDFCGQLFITVPGEIFSELTNTLREKEDIGILGYTNGYLMYITNENAYNNRWYEALSSPFEKGQGEYLVNEIRNIIKTYKEKNK
ncbi:hypothetical protein [Anaerorhabdus sp.]|uniref:hypothetical protein n=1 Tax=Anaerorhabdus sp. TaxID=1872524 RepID=UPI002FCA737B